MLFEKTITVLHNVFHFGLGLSALVLQRELAFNMLLQNPNFTNVDIWQRAMV